MLKNEHRTTERVSFVLIACIILALTIYSSAWCFFQIIGYYLGIVLHPDLDQKRKGYWKLYGLIFEHRKISHVPILGTLTRVIYSFPLWGGILYFNPPVLLLLNIFIGLVYRDALHLIFDLTSTVAKMAED